MGTAANATYHHRDSWKLSTMFCSASDCSRPDLCPAPHSLQSALSATSGNSLPSRAPSRPVLRLVVAFGSQNSGGFGPFVIQSSEFFDDGSEFAIVGDCLAAAFVGSRVFEKGSQFLLPSFKSRNLHFEIGNALLIFAASFGDGLPLFGFRAFQFLHLAQAGSRPRCHNAFRERLRILQSAA